MNTPVRLTAFAGGLAALFAAAALAGGAIDPDPGIDESKPAAHAMGGTPAATAATDAAGDAAEPHADAAEPHADAAGGHGAGAAVRGLAIADEDFSLEPATTTARPGARGELAFRIRDGHGVRTRFDVEHDRRMHVIVVRRDLSGFQHLHPRMAADGTWRVPLTLPEPGTYRVFADFSAGGKAHTLAADLHADGRVAARPLPAPASEATAEPGGLRVALATQAGHAGDEGELAFTARERDGTPARLQRHLGAQGHLVALREGDLAFLHVHPEAGRLAFAARFPSAGRYRLFLQIKTGGVVRTAAFTHEVAR